LSGWRDALQERTRSEGREASATGREISATGREISATG
jgi:hypothetical protein